MIRFSNKSDINGIVSLWNEAFDDSKSDIMFFINNRYKPQNTLVYELNGEVASMLFLLEGKMSVKGVDYASYYLYAACTSKKYRGRGLMASLLDFAKETACKRGYYFICLMPGEKSLFDFYEKHGYKSVFKKKILTVNREDVPLTDNLIFDTDKYAEDVALIRNNNYSRFDMFKWDNDAIEFAFKHNKLYGGFDISTREGYALYMRNNSIISVKEFAFTPYESTSFLSFLNKTFNADKYIVSLPVGYETTIGSFEIVPSAMMLAVNDEAEDIIGKIDNAYLGLTLD